MSESDGISRPRPVPPPTGMYRGPEIDPEGKPEDLWRHYPAIVELEAPPGMRVVPITQEMSQEVNDLFTRVFGEERPLDHYLWKFWRNPGGEPVGFAAVDDESGRIVAACPSLRKKVWIDGHEAGAIQLCETAVDPEARGGGVLYRALTMGVSRRGTQIGAAFAYGGRANRTAILIGQRHFNYRHFFALNVYERRLNLRQALGRRLGSLGYGLAGVTRSLTRPKPSDAEARFELAAVDHFGAEFDELWERLRGRYEFLFWRDAETLSWRYVECPIGRHFIWTARRDGQLVGYLVWRQWERDGVRMASVLDLFDGLDEEVAEALLSRATRDAAQQGCDFIQFATPPGSQHEFVISKLPGFELSEREAPDNIIGAPLQHAHAEPHLYEQQRVFLNESLWTYTPGDCDFHD